MCGRYSITTPAEAVRRLFGVATPQGAAWELRYNVAPTDPVPVVRAPEGSRELVELRWGLVPFYARQPGRRAKPLINARSETAASKPAFRQAFRHRRCLVVGDGFYEWERSGSRKLATHFRLASGQPIGFAGLWERDAFTILTTTPNALVEPLHDRMPVILPPEQFGLWLDPACEEVDLLQQLLVPFPAEAMQALAVGMAVNSVRNKGPECLEPRVIQGELF